MTDTGLNGAEPNSAGLNRIDEYTVLHMVKVKGFASAEAVAASIGAPVDEVEPLLLSAVEAGSAKHREGRLSGYTLTALGRERHAELRQASIGDDCAVQLTHAYECFLGPNREFKQLTTDWQLREEGSDTAPLLVRLDAMNSIAGEIITIASGAEGRFGVYTNRFDSALARLHGGDTTAFARPMSDSYHDVWMELHEDLVASLGHVRTEADE